MSLITIPELVIQSTVQNGLNAIRADLVTNASTPTNSILYQLVGGLVFEKYDYFNQLNTIVSTTREQPRFLNVDLMFNMATSKMPNIFVTTPAEHHSQAGIGLDTNFVGQINYNTGFAETYTKRFDATYDVVIVSDNSNEVIAIYHLVKALIISLESHLSFNRLENIRIGGQDLSPYTDVAPKNVFLKAIRLTLSYYSSTVDLNSKIAPINFNAVGTPVLS